MSVTVAILTYKRAWALQHSLFSIANQKMRPDEVLIILKKSPDDYSEQVISKFEKELPIRVIEQFQGNFVDAMQIAIENAKGKFLLFLDDDAIAEDKWVEKYVQLLEQHNDIGAFSGITYRAYIINGSIIRTQELETGPLIPTPKVFYRKPLPIFQDYCEWISVSGLLGSKSCNDDLIKSAFLHGANMGFKTELIRDCPLSLLYRRSKKGLLNEQVLAYCVRIKGYHIFRSLNPSISPIVWHISHESSLTRSKGFWHEFWLHYDRAMNYWRLKKLGAQVSLIAYIIAILIIMRRHPLPRLLATIYALINLLFY